MKKLFIVVVFCMLAIGTVFLFTQTDIVNELITGSKRKEIDTYNQDFEINKLKVSNQMYYYNTLNDGQKNIYTAIANSVRDLNNIVELNNYECDNNEEALNDIDVAMQAFFADHPEVFYVANKYNISTTTMLFKKIIKIELTYSVSSQEELDKEIAILEEQIDYYISKLSSNNMFEIELKLHDNLAKEVEYYPYEELEDIPNECHNVYGVFINKKAVCDGFAKAIQILLDRKEIESIIVTGRLDNESHAWNMVKLEDSWYHLDLTSDKSIKELRNEFQVVVHSYFNLTTEEILKSHILNDADIVPEATDTKYNYYLYTGKFISDSDNFTNKLNQLLNNNIDADLLEFNTVDLDDVPEKIIETLSKNRKEDYIKDNKINYYNIKSSYVIMKK